MYFLNISIQRKSDEHESFKDKVDWGFSFFYFWISLKNK